MYRDLEASSSALERSEKTAENKQNMRNKLARIRGELDEAMVTHCTPRTFVETVAALAAPFPEATTADSPLGTDKQP